MKIEKNIIIAAVCGVIIGAGGFALIDKPKHRAFHAMPHQAVFAGQMHKQAMMPMQGRNSQVRPELTAEQMATRFSNLDTNSDNKLDNTELTGRMAENFDVLDTDKDGFISLAEFESHPRQAHAFNGKQRQANMREGMENRNGRQQRQGTKARENAEAKS